MNDVLHALGFIAIFGVLFLSIIIWEAWYLSRLGRHNAYHFKETLANISTGAMYKVVDGIAIALFIQFFYDTVRQWGFQYEAELNWKSILLLFIASDFFYYFYHVAMHKVRWMWAVHVTHHSSRRLNFSTALRQNFLLDLNFGWMLWWIPLALIGFDKNWTIIAIEASLAYQFFLHTEVIRRLGPLEWVLNTPSHHRVHHGCQPDQIDRNFGGVLIIWDRLFGTFVDERDVSDLKYGLTRRQPSTLNPLRLNLDEFVQMWRDVWRYRDVSILWRRPDYVDTYYVVDEVVASGDFMPKPKAET
ncbi:MAG: sterol desaturase family protein [Oleiphilaceae bacterium]|nr:sterol desaturase family protein [Oleiphilaceae bacterium]